MDNKYLEVFEKYGFHFGRLLSGSKSLYHKNNSNNLIIFNARIYTQIDYEANLLDIQDFFEGQKHEVWYGDLDLNKDIYKLYSIYLDIKEPLVITTEMGRKILTIGD